MQRDATVTLTLRKVEGLTEADIKERVDMVVLQMAQHCPYEVDTQSIRLEE